MYHDHKYRDKPVFFIIFKHLREENLLEMLIIIHTLARTALY